MLKAKIHVTLKKSVLDPQGKTILNALHSLGFAEAKDVRVGKYFEIRLAGGDREEAEGQLKSMCDRLLSNPVIEEYQLTVEEAAEKAAK
jgi:phosphoribosylformylglycinamidine synthase